MHIKNPPQCLIAIFLIVSVAVAASENPSSFLIENKSADSITIVNLTASPVDQYYISAGTSLDIASASVPWKFPGRADNHFYLAVKDNNRNLCMNLPEADQRYGTLKIPTLNGKLQVGIDSLCSLSLVDSEDRKSTRQQGKVTFFPMPAIQKVVVGKYYDPKAEPIINFGTYTLDSNPAFDYKDPKNSVTYSVTGLPKGLSLITSGTRDYDPNYNGVIYGSLHIDTNVCPPVTGSPGYFKCKLTVTAIDPAVNWGGAARATIPLYMYDGLRAKTLTELAIENANHEAADIIRLSVGVKVADQAGNIVNLARYFTGAKYPLSYNISDMPEEAPLDITNKRPVQIGNFHIVNGFLRSHGLRDGQIVQLTIMAKSGAQTAKQIIYLSYSNNNKAAMVPNVQALQLSTGTSVWLYRGELERNRAKYSDTMRINNVNYAMPDIGWVQLKNAAKSWDVTATDPLDNNYKLAHIGDMSAWYKQHDPRLKFIVTYEFDGPLRGMLATLTNATSPDESRYMKSQMSMLVDSVASAINDDYNADGIQFDIEPMPTQPLAIEFFKQVSDKLARKGKIVQIYSFADAMNPDLALAANPLTVWLPSTYDVGLLTNPKNFIFDSNSLRYVFDRQCHFRARDVAAYYTKSWCSMNYDATLYANQIRMAARHVPPFGHIPGFGRLTALYGVHFQLAVPGEGSAMNWSEIELWNPQADSRGDYPSVVSGSQPVAKGDVAGRSFMKFSANLDPSGRPISQEGFIQEIIKYARSDIYIGTPQSNPLNIGLAVYGLATEKDVIGCRPGEKNDIKINCIVQLPVGIDADSPVWAAINRYAY